MDDKIAISAEHETERRAERGDKPFYKIAERLSDHFLAISTEHPIFRTNAGGEELWQIYIDALPDEDRQHFRCNACKSFIRRYGALVYIDDDLKLKSAVWNPSLVPGYSDRMVDVMKTAVEHNGVTIMQPFYTDEHIVGQQNTNGWHHFYIEVLGDKVRRESKVMSIHQRETEKRQNFAAVSMAISDYNVKNIEKAQNMLKWDSLNRAEKVRGVANVFLELAKKISRLPRYRKLLIWLYVANNPDGFCHIRSSVLGSLIEDIASGKFNGDQIAGRFNLKMDGLKYQRSKAAPSDGNIEQAEKVVAQMGIERSLKRRFALFDEVPKIWVSKEHDGRQKSGGGVFAHLKAQSGIVLVEAPEKHCSWAWFEREVLPEAKAIDVEFPRLFCGNFSALLTAVHDETPCLFQWGNHFSHYVYHGGSQPSSWCLEGTSAKVTGISRAQHMWDGATNNGNHQAAVLLLLDGCRDLQNPGLAIFPETLKGELHSVRKTIEAFSNAGKLEGAEEATACGLRIGKSSQNSGTVLRVTTRTGVARFSIDLWE